VECVGWSEQPLARRSLGPAAFDPMSDCSSRNLSKRHGLAGCTCDLPEGAPGVIDSPVRERQTDLSESNGLAEDRSAVLDPPSEEAWLEKESALVIVTACPRREVALVGEPTARV
jgi:hypothetical protein